jgi:protein-disulfide isomerase
MALDLNKAANLATVVVACCAVAATVSLLGSSRSSRSAGRGVDRPDTSIVANWAKYLEGGHSRGPDTAAVTILEFGDYECPFCVRFASTSDRILTTYPHHVRLVYRHWPLPNHRFAYPAARAAECAADQGRFWHMHDLIYAKGDSLGLVPFVDLARRAGVADLDQFEECQRKTGPVATIEAGIRDGQLAGGDGTPTLIVNGVLHRRGVDSAYVAGLIAARLQK